MDDWEESDSSTNEVERNEDNTMFTDSELVQALEEFQGKRKSSGTPAHAAPKRANFLLEEGILILPEEDDENENCPLSLDGNEYLVTGDSPTTTRIPGSLETAKIAKYSEPIHQTTGEIEKQNSPATFFELQTVTTNDADLRSDKISTEISLMADNPDDKAYESEAEDSDLETSAESLVNDIPFDGNAHEQKKRNVNNEANWKVEKNKKLRMQGESYLGFHRTREGKVFHDVEREERKMGDSCNSSLCRKSKLRACNNITEEMRCHLFTTFWKTMNWDQRRTFIVNSVEKSAVKRRKSRQNEESRREASLCYYLTIDGVRKQVCMVTYLNTFGIKKWTVRYWLNHKLKNDGIAPSTSVTHPPTMRISSARRRMDRNFVKQFFNLLPKMPSHYCRQSTTRKYLEPIVTSIAQLYNLYLKKFPQEKVNSVSRFTFESIFKQENLSLFSPRKDQCDLCCSYTAGNVGEEEYTKHIDDKNRARKEKT